ncbi:hypothetical protein LVJ94_36215 [Pendulispora rubella]|uniref:Secreted protein n=1 Tax=Pendulispora rubella TaxID=2741070 RepID=A0ABZ2KWA2_9BACT
MSRSTLTVLRILAAAVVAAVLFPSIAVSGCGGSKGSPAVDAGSTSAAAHVSAADAKADAGAAANSAAAPDAGVVDEPAPTVDNADLTLRGRHLLEAIAHGEPKLASDIVYPRDAYIATKDQPDPGKQWDKKVYPIFERDVANVRRRLHVPENAQFVSFELGPAIAQSPVKKRDLKQPVWRVRHSKLAFAVGGKPQRIEIAEMTGWHGAWYVSKLR